MQATAERYAGEEYCWGISPSLSCFEVLKHMPPVKPYRLLDIGCGEGRNAVFFARNGYRVTAFDLEEQGLEKTHRLARNVGVENHLSLFQADVNEFRLTAKYDILFSTGVLHYLLEDRREEIFRNYKQHTRKDSLNMFSVFVKKPFISPAPEQEETARVWLTGELFTFYYDWKIEWCTEEIFDCNSSGVPHRHAVNRMLARKGK